MGRAVDLFDHMSSMMKIEQEPRTYLTIRTIGSGIQNLLFADVRSVEDVEECVRAVRAESPQTGGVHGVGMRRDVGFVRDVGSPAFVQALEDAVVVLMIEKASAVEDLEALLSVKGVDMVNFGAADYSMSLGLTGQSDHPRVKEAERHVIETALRLGIAPRAEVTHPDEARRYLDMGVKHFCIGTDVSIWFNWLNEAGAAILNVLQKPAPGEAVEAAGYGQTGR